MGCEGDEPVGVEFGWGAPAIYLWGKALGDVGVCGLPLPYGVLGGAYVQCFVRELLDWLSVSAMN